MSPVQLVNGASAMRRAARSAARTANHVVERLLDFDAHGEQILSAYLVVNPSTALGQHVQVELHSLLEPIYEALATNQRSQTHLAEEEQAVRQALAQSANGARAVAIFACTPAGLCVVTPLPVEVTPAAYWDSRPRLRPLLSLIDEYEKSLVVLVDQQTARFFRVFLDQIEEIADVWDDVPGHHAQGGDAQSNIARWHDESVRWHLRRVSNALGEIADEEVVDRIVLGGNPEVISQLERLLPHRMRQRLAGQVTSTLFARPDEVLDRARAVLQAAERSYETRRVEELLNAQARGQAALGIEQVASAVTAGQVLLLIADADIHASGLVCARCELILPNAALDICPACGGGLVVQPDFIEYLAERVLQQGGRFEEVRGEAAERLISAAGGIAALLRYPILQPERS
ncbi:MAG TPA: Vms1/Ankzf1 family peptidyl-tRNA hydrolase [Longimicrobiales bacterium]|nr:Vms1/Ankzf1 family peptidyl-tRNA hydrolase [Longimicrobiales bacterium]